MKGRREDARVAAPEWERLADVSPLALSADCPLISGTAPLKPNAGLNGPPASWAILSRHSVAGGAKPWLLNSESIVLALKRVPNQGI
jgi:hypothetical protein